MARSLQRHGALRGMFTDAWAAPTSIATRLGKRLRQRFHQDLAGANVGHATLPLYQFEVTARMKGRKGWDRILLRNHWFQQQALRWLRYQQASIEGDRNLGKHPPVLFAYSYAARELFHWAKKQGWITVLGQIDPGIEEEQLMVRLCDNATDGKRWNCAPAVYWDDWYKETELADHIVVNSSWSRQLVIDGGIPTEKVLVVPLAYDTSSAFSAPQKNYPSCFSPKRPLKVLFLGQVTIRKGVLELLNAAKRLARQPIEFHLVGGKGFDIPECYRQCENVYFHGSVPRSDVNWWYRDCDLFLFPTHSDGFGLTQLEAISNRLPIIVSSSCGDVVRDGVNGRRLSEVSGKAIAEVLSDILKHPDQLSHWSRNCEVEPQFELPSVGRVLLESVT